MPTVVRTVARAVVKSGILLLLLVWVIPLASARAQQTGTVSGVVTDSLTGRPLPDAVVRADRTSAGTRTNPQGRFTLVGLTGTTVTLVVTHLGHQPVTQSATVGATDVAIQLPRSTLRLDELVITGQAGNTEVRALGNVVGVVDMAASQLATPSKGVQEALSVSVPGLQIQRASGQVGTGGVTRIRGVSSMSLSSEPIVFIDGVRADNTSGSNPVGFSGGGDTPSRINDIDPNDIESIQVLKGPSAATLYGTEASNGVIQIITKRGSAGRPTWLAELPRWCQLAPFAGREIPRRLVQGCERRDPARQPHRQRRKTRFRVALLHGQAGRRHRIGFRRHRCHPVLLQRELRPRRRDRQLQLAEQAQWHGEPELSVRREGQGRSQHGIYASEDPLGVCHAADDDLPGLGMPEQLVHRPGVEAGG